MTKQNNKGGSTSLFNKLDSITNSLFSFGTDLPYKMPDYSPDPTPEQTLDVMSAFKDLYKALQENDIDTAKQVVSRMAPEMKKLFGGPEGYAEMRAKRHGEESGLKEINKNYELLDEANEDIVMQVKLAMKND